MFGDLFFEEIDTNITEDDSTLTIQQFLSITDGYGEYEDQDGEKKSMLSSGEDFKKLAELLSRPICIANEEHPLQECVVNHLHLISQHMGTMAQCRIYGNDLQQSGVVTSLMNLLQRYPTIKAFNNVPFANTTNLENRKEQQHLHEIQVVTAALGAVRDLSCGNVHVRNHVRRHPGGLPSIASQLLRYTGISWNRIHQSPYGDLKLITNLCGAIRNVTHSSRENSMELHQLGVSNELVQRLLDGSNDEIPSGSTQLEYIFATKPLFFPDVTQPWREACYRSVASLVNIAEKCEECAKFCASNRKLTLLMVHCWGGKALIHQGLLAILNQQTNLPECLSQILVKEERRKKLAQQAQHNKQESCTAGMGNKDNI